MHFMEAREAAERWLVGEENIFSLTICIRFSIH